MPRPTAMPRLDQPTNIPRVIGIVARKPCCEPWAAQSKLFGPGVKHIGTMKTSNATKSASFKTTPQASVAKCCSVSASADDMSFQRSSTSSIPTLILTKPGTIPA